MNHVTIHQHRFAYIIACSACEIHWRSVSIGTACGSGGTRPRLNWVRTQARPARVGSMWSACSAGTQRAVGLRRITGAEHRPEKCA